MILHIVLLRFRPDVSEEDLRAFSQLVTDTCSAIPVVRRVVVGPRVDVDAGYVRKFGDATYDAGAVLEFANKDALVAYLRHPLHAELGKAFWAISAGAVIFEAEIAEATGKPPSA